MPNNRRNQTQTSGQTRYGRIQGRYPGQPRQLPGGDRYQTSGDWDRYETGREQRYVPDWDRDRNRGAERGSRFDGARSYSAGGYAEEFGYRADLGGQREGPYGEFERVGWAEDERGDEYFGAGSHYGGGFGTAPGSRASSAGTHGAPGYAGQGAWSDTSPDWSEESGGGRGTSGSHQHYGRSPYGPQSSYGRDYGQSYAVRPFRNYDEPRGYGTQQFGQSHWPEQISDQTPRGLEQSTRSFRGRGPKGYTRSDERLKEMLCEQLTQDPRIDASDIDIDVEQQVVKLSGTVEDRRTKYDVEEMAARCGAKDVDNQLRMKSR